MRSVRWNKEGYSQTVSHRTVVLCHGCFDVLHLGHIRHLQEAAKLGDWLVVSLTDDAHVQKGIGRPHFTAEFRKEALLALNCVDEVIINHGPDAVAVIEGLRPAFYVKGIDYVGSTDEGLERERQAIEAVGGKISFTNSRKFSSSQIIKAEKFSEETCRYLAEMKLAGARDRIFDAFDAADRREITFIGEAITDVYRYVQGLGRASKELMLATVQTGEESFLGGVSAAAQHGEFKHVKVLASPDPIVKTRYVDKDFNKKLFDVYSAREIDIDPEEREYFRNALVDAVSCSDVIVVNDFGHGLMGGLERECVQHAGFLAVNCQTNAGNYGFNYVTKYKKADYVCIDDPEARLAAGRQTEPIGRVVRDLTTLIDCDKYLITHGRFGSHWFDFTRKPDLERVGHAPALAEGGVDTMGAGDAVMAVTAPLIASGLDMASAALVGNIVGAIKVSILGHRRHVGRQEILQTVEALLA
jgi:rfaE bifunctional protein nucleotidyltransferase chain/domain